MALSDIALCSSALLKIGAEPIQSFDEGTIEAELAANLYAQARDALLSTHPWSFATAQSTLARLTGVPVADYAYAYQMPDDFMRVISAGSNGRGRGISYRLYEKRLHTDAEDVVLSYIFLPDEILFPAYFDQALIARLAAEFCLPLTESPTRADSLYRLAKDELKTARLIDSQGQPSMAVEDYSLIAVRS